MEVVQRFVWASGEFGELLAVGCDTKGNSYLVGGSDIYVLKDDHLEKTRTLSNPNSSDQLTVFSMSFDTLDRLYISTNWGGLQVFSNVCSKESDDLLFEEPEWQGPLNLSHPSGQLIGVNYKSDPNGVMCFIDWDKENPKTMIIKEWPAWGKDCGNWLMSGRDPIYSIRRSWYPSRIMVYIVDKTSYTTPEDGIRTLHMMFAPGTRNVEHLSHTFLSCPWDCELKMPFSVEIPHGNISSEILLLCPRGVITERGQKLLEFDEFEEESKYTKSFSATDFEGSGAKRSQYVLGFTTVENKNIVSVLRVKK